MGTSSNNGLCRIDVLGNQGSDKTKKIVLIAGPNYSVDSGTASAWLAKIFGVAEGTKLYNNNLGANENHAFGITQEHLDDLIKVTLKNWKESNGRECCYKFKGGKFESSAANPMTIDRAKSLVDKYSTEADLTIVQAHGIENAISGNETGLVFYKGKDPSNGFNWGITYPISSLTNSELTELSILACYDSGLPDSVGKTKIIKIGGDVSKENIGSEATTFIVKYINK